MRLSTIGIKYIHSTAYDKRRKSPKTLLHFDITVNIGVYFYKKRTIYDSDPESRRLKDRRSVEAEGNGWAKAVTVAVTISL